MLKSLIIRIFGRIASNLFFKKRKIDPQGIKTVLVNRSDRLGDAIISLPFLLELSKHFEVTVLTSKYNDIILRDFFKTWIVIDYPLSLPKVLVLALKSCLRFKGPVKPASSVPRYGLYLDLVGIRGLNIFFKIKEQRLCRYHIGFNLTIWSWLLNYAYKGSLELSNTGLVNAFQKLIKEGLGINLEIPDYLDLSSKMIKPNNFDLDGHFILINIAGFNKFRGPTPRMYAQLINSLDFNGKIIVMDELNQPNLKWLKQYVSKDNILYLEQNYSIWELLYLAKKSCLYIGADSGITHILQLPTNCLMFFATETPAVWKPFSKNPYHRKKAGKMVIEETINSRGLIKKIIYIPLWCRPCFGLGCQIPRCINDLDIETVSDEVSSILKTISKR